MSDYDKAKVMLKSYVGKTITDFNILNIKSDDYTYYMEFDDGSELYLTVVGNVHVEYSQGDSDE